MCGGFQSATERGWRAGDKHEASNITRTPALCARDGHYAGAHALLRIEQVRKKRQRTSSAFFCMRSSFAVGFLAAPSPPSGPGAAAVAAAAGDSALSAIRDRREGKRCVRDVRIGAGSLFPTSTHAPVAPHLYRDFSTLYP
jgi:hypothetical protein